jgi:hypothetical protein
LPAPCRSARHSSRHCCLTVDPFSTVPACAATELASAELYRSIPCSAPRLAASSTISRLVYSNCVHKTAAPLAMIPNSRSDAAFPITNPENRSQNCSFLDPSRPWLHSRALIARGRYTPALRRDTERKSPIYGRPDPQARRDFPDCAAGAIQTA